MRDRTRAITYTVGDGESHTHLGVLWPVLAYHGKCGCGEVEMSEKVAFFRSREKAQQYVKLMQIELPLPDV